MSDCITGAELQHLLNQFENLEGVEVVEENSVILLAEKRATIRGAIRVHGEYYVYELTIDLKKIKSADDVLEVVGKLHKAIGSFANNPVH